MLGFYYDHIDGTFFQIIHWKLVVVLHSDEWARHIGTSKIVREGGSGDFYIFGEKYERACSAPFVLI